MLIVNSRIKIAESELRENFVQSSGPGGQNVNKVATAVQLRFDAAGSAALPETVRERLLKIAGRRADKDGVITVVARQFRTRERNREAARERLIKIIERALHKPVPRRPTRTPRRAHEKRIQKKRQLSDKKRLRQNPLSD